MSIIYIFPHTDELSFQEGTLSHMPLIIRVKVSLMYPGECHANPPPFIYQHHHHAGSGRPVSSWDAIQSLILSTVEQRFCFADKMLSSGEVLLLRGLPVSQDFAELPYLLLWTFSSTSQGAAVHGRWNPRRTQQCPGATRHTREKKTAVWTPQDPFGL